MRRLIRALLRSAVASPRIARLLQGVLLERNPAADYAWIAERLAAGVALDLDAPPHPDDALLWSMLWEGSRLGRFGPTRPIPASYRLGDHRFRMDLDLAETPECGYAIRNPAPHLTRLIRAGGRGFLDVGANVGFHSLCASGTFEVVHAFEPTPATVGRLRRNVELSGLADRVRIHEIALSDQTGRARMAIEPRHCGANRIDGTAGGGLDIATDTLDRLDAEGAFEAVDLVKIDVEGHQDAVVRGGRAMLERHRPSLFVELGSVPALRSFRSLLPDGYRAMIPSATSEPRPMGRDAEARSHRDLLFESEA